MISAGRMLSVCALTLILASCGDRGALPAAGAGAAAAVSRTDLDRTAKLRIVFAHQSVGQNILDGLRTLVAEQGSGLRILETRRPPAGEPGLFHFKVGQNGAPEGKIQDYVQTVSSDPADIDVALLKLCFIDFNAASDPRRLAQDYADAIQRLQAARPQTRFVAITAPLTTVQTGPKAWIKRLLGQSPAGYDSNLRRQAFNDVLRQRFPHNRLFDLARLESTAGGAPIGFEVNGQHVEALDPALSSDGGHLNARGARLAASALVHFLSAPTS